MDPGILEQARQTRDARFDGRFFIGVKSTGIYCRPVCPVKIPQAKNVTFYSTAAAAAEAGFRPCLRCRPESSPGTPAWMGTSTTVSRGLKLIAEGALDNGSVEALASRLGVTSRHLRRLFDQHLGASPNTVALTRRIHFAKKLVDETTLSMIEIALAAGYSSVRRFNDHFQKVYARSPGSIRRGRVVRGGALSQQPERGLSLRLCYRPPFDYAGIVGFLKLRAIPGVEQVVDGIYSRTIVVGNQVGRVQVSDDPDNRQIRISIEHDDTSHCFTILERLKSMFDLTADPLKILQCFATDKKMHMMALQNPGQRVPGCWDPFEIAIRAIVGQQISVKGATTIMGRIAASYGAQTPLGLCFPTPRQLRVLDVAAMPMPQRRAQTIKDLSCAVDQGEIDFTQSHRPDELVERLLSLKGIGHWTAQYIAMRALNDPDAFLSNDLVLLKVASKELAINTNKLLLERSNGWRPWRAYAGMHLWRQAGKAAHKV
ncbi:MAG: helix-turn-helix domain-containing protein [Pseudomonadales bacterium]|nr:helix-turn-helix domain-containing protein [Pseudomonadales bacterium]